MNPGNGNDRSRGVEGNSPCTGRGSSGTRRHSTKCAGAGRRPSNGIGNSAGRGSDASRGGDDSSGTATSACQAQWRRRYSPKVSRLGGKAIGGGTWCIVVVVIVVVVVKAALVEQKSELEVQQP